MPRYRSKNFPRLHKRDHEISGSWQRIFSLQHGSAQLQLYTEYLDSRIVKADRVSHRKVKDRPTITDFIKKRRMAAENIEDAYVKFPASCSSTNPERRLQDHTNPDRCSTTEVAHLTHNLSLDQSIMVVIISIVPGGYF